MKTVLIVEDNKADQIYDQFILKGVLPNLNILFASDGQEALDIYKEKSREIDLILLDINMPRMNGHDFLAEFSKLVTPEQPAVVMLTSSDQATDKDNALKYEFVKDYMLKPIRAEKVQNLSRFVKSTNLH